MKKTLTAIFPGTFDPITNGHVDLVSRAAQLFPRLIVAVAESPNKNCRFSLAERVDLASTALEHLLNVEIIGYSNLMADFANQNNASILVRGVRSTHDFEYEKQLAEMNRHLNAELETIFLMPSSAIGFVSSTLIKEVVLHGGDISTLVPKRVDIALRARMNNE